LSVLDRINLFIEIYFRIFRRLKSIKLIAPFIILAFFQGLWLTILVYFYYSPINKLFSPLLSYFYSEKALHFPYFYYLLPQLYSYGSLLVLDFIFGIILSAAAVFMIGADFKQEKGGFAEGFRTAFKSLPALMIIWIVKTGLIVLFFMYGGPLIFPLVNDLPMSYFLGFFLVQMIALAISAFLVYAYPAVLLHRMRLFPAIGESVVLTLRNFVFTFIILFIPWLIQFPIGYITSTKAYLILGKFNTTTLIYLMSANIVISLIANYLLFAGITYFYLNRTE